MKQYIRTMEASGLLRSIYGTPIVVPGYEKYSFLFHKFVHMKGYGITEVTSGFQVIPYWEYCKNKAQAIETAQRYLEKYHGCGSYDSIIQQCLNRVNGGKALNKPIMAKKKTKIKQSTILGDNNE